MSEDQARGVQQLSVIHIVTQAANMSEREDLQWEILQLTELILDNEAVLLRADSEEYRELLVRATAARKEKLEELMQRFGSLRHS